MGAHGCMVVGLVTLAALSGCLQFLESETEAKAAERLSPGVPLVSFDAEECNPSGSQQRAGVLHKLPGLDGTRREVAGRLAELLGESVASWQDGTTYSTATLEDGSMTIRDNFVTARLERPLFEPSEIVDWTEELLQTLGSGPDDRHVVEHNDQPYYGGEFSQATIEQRAVVELAEPHEDQSVLDQILAREAYVSRLDHDGNVTTDVQLGFLYDMRMPDNRVDVQQVMDTALAAAECWLESEGRGDENLRPGQSGVWMDIVQPANDPGSLGLGMMFKIEGETGTGMVENIDVTLDAYTHAVLDMGHGMATS